jgi:DNA-binding response OmpR family regulator
MCVENAASGEPLIMGAGRTTKRKKVLLVDDSAFTLFIEQMLLSQSTHIDIVTAIDGEQAVRIALAEKPDLIVMDVVMPRMNGVQACRAMRSAVDTRETPIILVITRDEDDAMVGGYASGCTGYLHKPINPSDFMAVIQQHLREDGEDA